MPIPQSHRVSLCTVVANSEDCLPRYFAWAIPRLPGLVLVRSDSEDGSDALLEEAASRWPDQIRLLDRSIDTIARQKQVCIEQAHNRMFGCRHAGHAGIHILHWGHIRSVEQLTWKSPMRRSFAETDYLEGEELASIDKWFHVRNQNLDTEAALLPPKAAATIRRLEETVASGRLDTRLPQEDT